MAKKRAARSSSSEPDSPLTEADTNALRRKFGDGFRDFTNDEWRQFRTSLSQQSKRRPKGPDDREVLKRPLGGFFVAIMEMSRWRSDLGLPPAPTSPDDTLRMLVVAANYYWERSANPTSARDSKQQLEKLINTYRRAGADLSKLGNFEELFLTVVIIDRLEKKHRELLIAARPQDGAVSRRRQFISDLLLIWLASGGKIGQSTDPYSGERTGPLIRYLTFACRVVMGHSPADETLRDHIRGFKWNPASRRRPRKKK